MTPRGNELSFEIDRLAQPGQLEDLQVLVEAGIAGLEVDPERGELRLHVPHPGPEGQPAAREHIEGGRSLGQEKWVPVRNDRQVGQQAQPGGAERHGGQGHEGVQRVVAPGLAPPLARGRMLGHVGGTESGLLRLLRQRGEGRPTW